MTDQKSKLIKIFLTVSVLWLVMLPTSTGASPAMLQRSGDSFEPDNSPTQASWILSGRPQAHSIDPEGDVDWVTFTLTQVSAITLETSGTRGDTVMWLYDQNLNLIEYDDDDGNGYFSRINRSCPGPDFTGNPLPPGTYFVEIREKYGYFVISSYNLSFTNWGPCPIPDLTYNTYQIDDNNSGDSSGNNNGIADCGETIELYVSVRNQGNTTATGVNAILGTNDPYVDFLYEASSSYPNISAGGTGTNYNDFDLSLDANIPAGHLIQFYLNIIASNGGPWLDSFAVPVTCGVDIFLPVIFKN